MDLISVIFPSRGRPGSLRDSIQSLMHTAVHPERVEILVAVDPDDGDDFTGVPARRVVAPERFGYNRMHEYFNYLAAQAQGKWLCVWGDDVHMQTRGWDNIIDGQAEALLWPYCGDDWGGNVFPVVPKAWADCLGHISLVPYLDLWIQAVAEALPRRLHHIPVIIQHRKTFDQTHAEGNGQGFETRYAEYHTPAMFAAREKDAEILRQRIGNEPGNLQLITVLLPLVYSLPERILKLMDEAIVPDEVEFLIAAGFQHSHVRTALEAAGVMGHTEVHSDHATGALWQFSHGRWIVQWEEFDTGPGWDVKIRER